MELELLKEKALSLPHEPGVYIMQDKADRVIYVGKAKRLKSRVCQYFQDTGSHSAKTRLMVSKIDHFDVIVTASEFEALVLECSLIKRHMPKYNILLKDDKGYPYIRMDDDQMYPSMRMVSKIADDGAEYYGPFGSRGITNSILSEVRSALKLPDCNKVFPRDIGKGRPCLNYHINRCAGWCQSEQSAELYQKKIAQARQLLTGNFKGVANELRNEMLDAADSLNFELAASIRDRLAAVESLGKKQLVTSGSSSDVDVIGYAQTEVMACFAVLHYRDGNLIDKEYEVFSVPDDPHGAVSSLIKQYYLSRGFAPRCVLLPFVCEDSDLFSQLLEERLKRKTHFKVPQRGDNARLVALAVKNAQEEAERVTDHDERVSATVKLLGKMLGVESLRRMESFDISNIGSSDIVAGMVVFQDGKPRRSEYKRFKIDGLIEPDDYASMHQVILRRFQRYVQQDKGFSVAPDILLIDGGTSHARTALDALQSLKLDIPVFGMVKDDRHRTRALVTPEGKEIRIDANQSVFAMIGSIQEETHRFAITYHRNLRSKRMRYSELDGIPGIGAKRKELLLKKYKSIQGIRGATVDELKRILPADAAVAVYDHFHVK